MAVSPCDNFIYPELESISLILDFYLLKGLRSCYHHCVALNHKRNILLVCCYYPKCIFSLYTAEGYFITKFAIASSGELMQTKKTVCFDDDVIALVPCTPYSALIFSDCGIRLIPVHVFIYSAIYRNGKIYILSKYISVIQTYSLTTENITKFGSLRSCSKFLSSAINGDQMVILTKSSLFPPQLTSGTYYIDRLCLITETVLQTLTLPLTILETFHLTHCCLDAHGTVLIRSSSRNTHYRLCVWSPDRSIRLYQPECEKNDATSLIGFFLTDNNMLINVYITVV